MFSVCVLSDSVCVLDADATQDGCLFIIQYVIEKNFLSKINPLLGVGNNL